MASVEEGMASVQEGGEKPAAPAPPSDPVVTSVVRRWRTEGRLEKGGLVLRAVAALLSALAAVVMASNKHGDWREFDKYEEYRYIVAIAVLAFLYSTVQVVRQIHHMSTGRELISRQASALLDFAGDQVVAYLLISASSAAVPLTNRMREGADNIFTDASAAAISLAFFAFFALALSALISGYKLSKQTYI